jgi:putative ATPase
LAIRAAQAEVRAHGVHPVPVALRNAPTKLMQQLGYGEEYRYSHDGEGNFQEQEFLPDALRGKRFYEPGHNASEQKIQERLRAWWGQKYGY